MSTPDPILTRIEEIISSERVVLFMKGTADAPQCGFSAQTAAVLQGLGVSFKSVDVLSDPEIRQGIKVFSDWPTITQLYIDKEFIGGSDIVTQMFGSGELHPLLGIAYEPPKPPEITVSEAFIKAIQAALSDTGGDLSVFPRIQISPQFEYGIGVSERNPGDLEVEAGGLVFLIDPSSAERAGGMHIDILEGPDGGVAIENPNEPSTVLNVNAADLQRLRESATPHHLIDVRTETEWTTARIEGAVFMDEAGQRELLGLPKDTMIVVMCHHGIRSGQAAKQLVSMGYSKVHNLVGGIEAWSTQIDTSVPRY